MKFTEIDRHGAPLCGASFLAKMHERKCLMERRAAVRFLTVKGLKSRDVEMELTSVYDDEGCQISAGKKWRRRFLQRRTELGDDPRSGKPANSDLT
jgi:transposase